MEKRNTMIGMKEIAKKAGVSVSTVSNVFRNKKNVGKETREKVLRISKELNYTPPNLSEDEVKNDANRTVLFVFSDFDRSFYLKVLKGINDYLNSRGYDLVISTHRACEKFMKNSVTCGCIILDDAVKNDMILRCANKNYPIVVLDRIVDSPYVKSILVDSYTPMCEMVQELVKKGYKRYAFLGGKEDTIENQERYRAFSDTLEKNNIVFQWKDYFSGDYRRKSGYMAAKLMTFRTDRPEVLVCANDNMAVGAIKCFRENRIKVPEDIAVTGFDDGTWAAEMDLTTIIVPDYERGYLAALYLTEALMGRGDSEIFYISTTIKWRKTTL